MRIVVLIIGLVVAAITFYMSYNIMERAAMFGQEEIATKAAVGVFVSVMIAISAAFGFAYPRISGILFFLAGGLGLMIGNDGYDDMIMWGIISIILGILIFVVGYNELNPKKVKTES